MPTQHVSNQSIVNQSLQSTRRKTIHINQHCEVVWMHALQLWKFWTQLPCNDVLKAHTHPVLMMTDTNGKFYKKLERCLYISSNSLSSFIWKSLADTSVAWVCIGPLSHSLMQTYCNLTSITLNWSYVQKLLTSLDFFLHISLCKCMYIRVYIHTYIHTEWCGHENTICAHVGWWGAVERGCIEVLTDHVHRHTHPQKLFP